MAYNIYQGIKYDKSKDQFKIDGNDAQLTTQEKDD